MSGTFTFPLPPPPPPKATAAANSSFVHQNNDGAHLRGGRQRGRGGPRGFSGRGRGDMRSLNSYAHGNAARTSTRPTCSQPYVRNNALQTGHPAKKVKLEVAPAVPSFGTPLFPPQLQSSTPAVVSATTAPLSTSKRKTNQLGLTPVGETYEASDDNEENDEDEEAALAPPKGGPLSIEHNGQIILINSAAAMKQWIEQRRKRWPTEQRVKDKNEALENRRQELKLLRDEAAQKWTLSRDNGTTRGRGRGAKSAPRGWQRNDNRARPNASDQPQSKEDVQAELERQLKKVEELRAKLRKSEQNKDSSSRPDEPSDKKQNILEASTSLTRRSSSPALSTSSSDVSSGSDLSDDQGLLDDVEAQTHIENDISSDHAQPEQYEPLDEPPDEEIIAQPFYKEEVIESSEPATTAGARTKPRRPDKAPCQAFIKTGRCKYGRNCKFKHDRAAIYLEPARKSLYQRFVEKEREQADRVVLSAIKYLGERGMLDRKA